jgi:CRISPR-associated protein Cas6
VTNVDVSFALRGTWVPRDHGYALYGALSRVVPVLHGAEWLAVHPIIGVTPDVDRLHLSPKAELRLRVPVEHIGTLMPLAGKCLDIHGQQVTVGVPTVYPLNPAAVLDARVVLLKITAPPLQKGASSDTHLEPLRARYRAEVGRQLHELAIGRPYELLGPVRMTIRERTVVGFSVRVAELSAEESMRLMVEGVGGRRRMGAGVFRPARGIAHG